MYMVMCVLDDPAVMDQLLDAWCKLGVTGATIMDSTGLHRRNLKHIPMRYVYGDQPMEERGNSTLFAIVDNENIAHLCLAEVERIVGDLDGPNTGVFAAWPLAIVKGVRSSGLT